MPVLAQLFTLISFMAASAYIGMKIRDRKWEDEIMVRIEDGLSVLRNSRIDDLNELNRIHQSDLATVRGQRDNAIRKLSLLSKRETQILERKYMKAIDSGLLKTAGEPRQQSEPPPC